MQDEVRGSSGLRQAPLRQRAQARQAEVDREVEEAAADVGLEQPSWLAIFMLTRAQSAMPTTETSDEALISRMNSLMSGGVEIRSACGRRTRRRCRGR